jgi:hypothetical protein
MKSLLSLSLSAALHISDRDNDQRSGGISSGGDGSSDDGLSDVASVESRNAISAHRPRRLNGTNDR